MKNVHSRETLTSIDCYPFEDEVLERLADVNERGIVIRLTYHCICRYMNVFAQKYGVPTTCDVEKFFLTKDMLFNDEGMCEFYEEAEYNGDRLLYQLVAYCDWDYLYLSEDELREAGLELEEVLKGQLDKSELFTEEGVKVISKMPNIIANGCLYESGSVHIVSIKGLPQYLRFKESHPEIVQEHFRLENCIIHGIVENITDVLIENTLTDYDVAIDRDNDSDEFLLGWITGSNGYYYASLAHLNPNWVICMYVLHGLLGHAQTMFGHWLKGSEER